MKSSLIKNLAELIELPDEKTSLACILEAFTEAVEGIHYSALYHNFGCPVVDMKFPDSEWLGVDHKFCRSISEHSDVHPFVANLKKKPRSVTLLRSQLIDDSEWLNNVMYQAVDKPLGIRDMIAVYILTPAGHIGGVFCGTDKGFTDQELEAAEHFRKIASALFKHSNSAYPSEEISRGNDSGISAREAEVMDWVAFGKTNIEISIILGISHHTVRSHLEHLFQKLEVNNRNSASIEWRKSGSFLDRSTY